MILDGRNRYRALKSLGITPAEEHFRLPGTKAEAEAYVISTNLHRRQLNNQSEARVRASDDCEVSRQERLRLGLISLPFARTPSLPHERPSQLPGEARAEAFAKAWNALSEEQQVSFVLAHRADIRDMLATEASVNLTAPIPQQPSGVAGGSS